jgi:outer membrane lipoprotein-sorting protein
MSKSKFQMNRLARNLEIPACCSTIGAGKSWPGWEMSMQKIKIAVLIFVLCTIGAGWATAGTAGSLAEIRAAAGKITSIKGDFIQEKKMPILAHALVARGYFAYQQPDSLRWEYREPLHSVLLLHDGEAHRFIQTEKGWREDNEASMQSMEFVIQEIAKWLNGRFDDNALFSVALEPGGKIVMTPKDKGMRQFIQRIVLIMDHRPGVIKEVVISESPDSFTRFTFLDPKINEPVDPTEFQKAQ